MPKWIDMPDINGPTREGFCIICGLEIKNSDKKVCNDCYARECD